MISAVGVFKCALEMAVEGIVYRSGAEGESDREAIAPWDRFSADSSDGSGLFHWGVSLWSTRE